jgi:predicted DNA-binding protein
MSPEVYNLIQDLKSRLAAIKSHFSEPKHTILVTLAEKNVEDIVKALESK